MINDKENQPDPQNKFKEKMKNQGKSEIRGVFLATELHPEVKKILRMYVEHREQILLYCNSLD